MSSQSGSGAEQRAIFFREIRLRPDDDTPRLVLADWLQDQGDPRGELVYLQVHRRRLAEDDPQRLFLQQRERTLLRDHVFDWLGPLADLAGAWTFQRGFLRLEMCAERLLGSAMDAPAVREAFEWVEELSLHDLRREHFPGLLAADCLHHLTALDLSENRLGNDGVETLVTAPWLENLWSLSLSGTQLGQRSAEALARCAGLRNLRRLDLSRNRPGESGLLALVESPFLDRLDSFDLSGTTMTVDALVAVRARFGDALVLNGRRFG